MRENHMLVYRSSDTDNQSVDVLPVNQIPEPAEAVETEAEVVLDPEIHNRFGKKESIIVDADFVDMPNTPPHVDEPEPESERGIATRAVLERLRAAADAPTVDISPQSAERPPEFIDAEQVTDPEELKRFERSRHNRQNQVIVDADFTDLPASEHNPVQQSESAEGLEDMPDNTTSLKDILKRGWQKIRPVATEEQRQELQGKTAQLEREYKEWTDEAHRVSGELARLEADVQRQPLLKKTLGPQIKELKIQRAKIMKDQARREKQLPKMQSKLASVSAKLSKEEVKQQRVRAKAESQARPRDTEEKLLFTDGKWLEEWNKLFGSSFLLKKEDLFPRGTSDAHQYSMSQKQFAAVLWHFVQKNKTSKFRGVSRRTLAQNVHRVFKIMSKGVV